MEGCPADPAMGLGGKSEQTTVEPAMRFGRVVGGSHEMRALYPLCERLAGVDVPLVIEGETGTGKEQLAEALHERGARAKGPFVVFDCTVGTTLMESALFGHQRGAFTGAVASRKGAFESAEGGTLLIDEVGDLDAALQSKLLRAIDRREVQPIGANHWSRVDVRVIAATRRDLAEEVRGGRFRDDLYYRLAVARMHLPPLRIRTGDVALLARHFWRRLGGSGGLPDEFLASFAGHDWPGNVRELHNAVTHYVALGELPRPRLGNAVAAVEQARENPNSEPVRPKEPDDVLERILARDLPFSKARDAIVAEFERRYADRLVALHGGSVTRAAGASGIGLRHFQRIRARQAPQWPASGEGKRWQTSSV
jgi:two-component system response regulator HydG